jgi:hypothetical protein
MAEVEGRRPLGILMLETRFARLPGDIGNPASFAFPVIFEVVEAASADRVVRERAKGLLDSFIDAGKRLVDQGAIGLMTSCGFLALHQPTLAAALPVPVATSSLLMVPMVERLLPAGRRVGVLTASADDLTAAHLAAVGGAVTTPIGGLEPASHLATVLFGGDQLLDPTLAQADLMQAADRLLARHQDIGALVLECTNMGPYAPALARHTGLPAFDVVGFAHWFYRGLCP